MPHKVVRGSGYSKLINLSWIYIDRPALQLFLQLGTHLEFPKTLICGGTEVLVSKSQ